MIYANIFALFRSFGANLFGHLAQLHSELFDNSTPKILIKKETSIAARLSIPIKAEAFYR